MTLEKIVLTGKRKRKLSGLTPLFSDMGFNKITLKRNKLTIEKSLGKTLEGKQELDYRILFEDKKITFVYSVFSQTQRRSRRVEALATLLNVLTIIEEFYTLDLAPVIAPVLSLLKDLGKVMDKEGVDLTQKLDETTRKNSQLVRKYEDLVISSEENARLLLESERRNDELTKRLEKLEGISDESLKEELFQWIKLHEGYLDVSEFSKTYKIPAKRVEEGVNFLIREGYIRKK